MKYNRGGLIIDVIVVVVILIVLGYFGININNVIHSQPVQSNLNWFWAIVEKVWSWISGPVLWFWNTLVLGVLWHGIQAGLSHVSASSTPQ